MTKYARVSEPEADTRKKDAFTYMIVLGFTALVTGYYKRFKWATFKTRAITYVK
jgi:ubiquinol-cytochrome c reductase cytochrome c1 subunit